jgi:hypothetical protein
MKSTSSGRRKDRLFHPPTTHTVAVWHPLKHPPGMHAACGTQNLSLSPSVHVADQTGSRLPRRLCFIEVVVHRDDCSHELLEWGSRVSAANSRRPNPQ